MLLRHLYIPPRWRGTEPIDESEWPFTIPFAASLSQEMLRFTQPVTFLVGENGSGKSTLVEAIAEAYGINVRAGWSGAPLEVPLQERSILGANISLDLTSQGIANKKCGLQGYYLRAETTFDFLELVTSSELVLPDHWLEDLRVKSHGEGFMAALCELMREPVLYLLDEPEAALSFTACVELIGVLQELGKTGAQAICATHSPLLAATPGADIIELGDHGARHMMWEDLQLVDQWRRFLAAPGLYLDARPRR